MVLLGGVAELRRRWRRGELSDACYAVQYFLNWQIALHGRRFASRRYKQDPRPDAAAWLAELRDASDSEARVCLHRYLQRYGFLGVIPNAITALQSWLHGHWPLILCEHIPAPEQMLRLQVQGTRVVTVITEPSRLLQPVLSKANAFAFMIHDLEHAYKFFHDPVLHEGQRCFYRRMLTLCEQGMFEAYRYDPVFSEKFDYLISDMNTHRLHSLQFLRAILIEYHLRQARLRPCDMLSSKDHNAVEAIMALFHADNGEGVMSSGIGSTSHVAVA